MEQQAAVATPDFHKTFNILSKRVGPYGQLDGVIRIVKWEYVFSSSNSDAEYIHGGENVLSYPEVENFISVENVTDSDIENWIVEANGGDLFLETLKEIVGQALQKMEIEANTSETQPTMPPPNISNIETYKSDWSYMKATLRRINPGGFFNVTTGNNQLVRTQSFTYVTEGAIKVENPNRPLRVYNQSKAIVAGGLAFPGRYTISADVFSKFICVTFDGNIDMYSIKEVSFEPTQAKTVTQWWEKALVIQGKVSVNGQEFTENTYFNPAVGNSIVADESSLVLFTRKKEDEDASMDPDAL